MISLIAAMTSAKHVIGWQGTMPWHLPADLAWFKQNTIEKPVLMGRKTWDSLGRALPKRRNIVITQQTNLAAPHVEFVHTPVDALKLVADQPEVMVIGGAQLYRQFLPMAQRMYLTFIDANLSGDTFFPSYNQADWRLIHQTSYLADAKNPYNYSFTIYERI